MKILSIIALAIGAETLVPHLMAQEAPSPSQQKAPADGMFKKLDLDANGQISKSEFLAMPRMQKLPEKLQNAIFTRLDQDKDGALNVDEIREMRKEGEKRRAEKLRKFDTDQSGGLSFSEMSADPFFAKLPDEKRREIFQRMDTDGNGEINALDQRRKKH